MRRRRWQPTLVGLILTATLGTIAPLTRASAGPDGAPAPAGNGINVESLLGRMADLRWLAQPPQPGERTVQYSSYDRATRLGPDGQFVDRFANGDCGHYLRVDRLPDGSSEFVLAEAQGPGYVSRIWSANPDGTIRIFIDGDTQPAIQADFAALTHGKVAPFVPPFGQETARGCSLYFPIPFQRSIRIVTTKGNQYYQVAVTTLPPGSNVESYTPAVLARATQTMRETSRRLAEPDLIPLAAGARIVRGTTAGNGLPPGGSIELLDHRDPGAIARLRIHVDAAQRDEALARCRLAITFDGAAAPQVAVPVGDFFGTGPGLNVYAALPARVDPQGWMTARWYMPFGRSARIRLTNQSSELVRVSSECAIEPVERPDALLRFHARWLLEDGIATQAGAGTREWPALRVAGGPGRFVGLALGVFNPTPAWWGEGDEKIYVDGEPFPSTIGTGTEDYFGYAWCDPHPYMHPYHAQTRCDGPGNRGYTSNVRYQVLDSVPFQKALAFDLEVWHWKAVKVQYGSVAYAYAAPGAVVAGDVPDLTNRVIHPPGPGIYREPGVVEAEALRVLDRKGGELPNQDMSGFGEPWSGARQLWWTRTRPGDRLSLALPVEKPGTYRILGGFTRAPDYATITLALDGEPLGAELDLYAPAVAHSGPVTLGRVSLSPGDHALQVTVSGRNARSTNTLVGVDWFRLEPVK